MKYYLTEFSHNMCTKSSTISFLFSLFTCITLQSLRCFNSCTNLSLHLSGIVARMRTVLRFSAMLNNWRIVLRNKSLNISIFPISSIIMTTLLLPLLLSLMAFIDCVRIGMAIDSNDLMSTQYLPT